MGGVNIVEAKIVMVLENPWKETLTWDREIGQPCVRKKERNESVYMSHKTMNLKQTDSVSYISWDIIC